MNIEALKGRHYKGGDRLKLHIPKPHQFKEAIFNKEFEEFLKRVKASSSSKHELTIKNELAHVKISYEPGKKYFHGGHPSFEVVYQVDANPLYQALKDKAKQLKETNLECPKGIIVCDGGYPLINHQNPGLSFSLNDVLRRFFQNHASVDFVLVLSVQNAVGLHGPLKIQWTCMTNASPPELPHGLGSVFGEMVRALPEPIRTGRNTLVAWETRYHERAWMLVGGMGIGDKHMTIKISAQSLLKLMAGKVTMEQILQDVPTDDPLRNECGIALKKGYVIRSAKFIANPDEDNDWIEMVLSGPDASIGSFFRPEQDEQKSG